MARLALAAILIFEATNKTSLFCGTSDFNETLASLIFMLVMKNIRKWGLRGQNYRSFTNNSKSRKSTLFTKMSSNGSENENFLYIRKWINGKF